MDYYKANSMFLQFIIELCNQSEGIVALLKAIDSFEEGHAQSSLDVAKFTPADWHGKKFHRSDEIPENLIQAQISEERLHESKGIYAGALFVALSSWIQSVGKRLELDQTIWLATGEQILGEPLARIIWAAANNFRHYDEWHTVTGRNQPSINVLRNIGLSGPPWNSNRASEILDLISLPRDFDKLLNTKLAPIAHEMFYRSTGKAFWIPAFTYGWD